MNRQLRGAARGRVGVCVPRLDCCGEERDLCHDRNETGLSPEKVNDYERSYNSETERRGATWPHCRTRRRE